MAASNPQNFYSPKNVVACDPELKAATAKFYDLRNKQKPRNFIFAEITASGYFKYYVENLPQDGTGCPGKWLFEVAWEHFIQSGVTILGIRGEWDFGDNLATVNRLTANQQMTIAEAAAHTWAWDRANEKGFTKVTVFHADGNPGNYRSVELLFEP